MKNRDWTDADDMVNHNNDNRVHTMKNRDWTDEQKKRIVEIDENESKRGRNFMKRIKNRWEAEYQIIEGQRKTS